MISVTALLCSVPLTQIFRILSPTTGSSASSTNATPVPAAASPSAAAPVPRSQRLTLDLNHLDPGSPHRSPFKDNDCRVPVPVEDLLEEVGLEGGQAVASTGLPSQHDPSAADCGAICRPIVECRGRASQNMCMLSFHLPLSCHSLLQEACSQHPQDDADLSHLPASPLMECWHRL